MTRLLRLRYLLICTLTLLTAFSAVHAHEVYSALKYAKTPQDYTQIYYIDQNTHDALLKCGINL